ncbi:MAG: transposase [Candidatus Riflebacteria bacterium]|nr:transposase [Candidatus Riflebacteria bacterium]
MLLKSKSKEIGTINCRYLAAQGVCQKCKFQPKCCPQNSRRGRSVRRTIYAPEILAFREKMKTEEAKAVYKKRSQTAEFPNAWIKEKIGLRQFRLRGLLKVSMEAMWACITYNIQRWIGLKWRCRWEINEG